MERPSPERRKPTLPPYLTEELRGLSRGEIAFLILVGVAVVGLAFVAPGGAAVGLAAALVIGVLAGATIAVKRRRQR